MGSLRETGDNRNIKPSLVPSIQSPDSSSPFRIRLRLQPIHQFGEFRAVLITDQVIRRLGQRFIVGVGQQLAFAQHVQPAGSVLDQVGLKGLFDDITGEHGGAAAGLHVVLQGFPCQFERELEALDDALLLDFVGVCEGESPLQLAVGFAQVGIALPPANFLLPVRNTFREVSLLFFLDGVLEFQNGKIQFDGRFGISRLQIIVEKASDQFSAALHEFLLLGLVLLYREHLNAASQLTDLGKGLDDGQRGLNRPGAFQDCRQHVEPFFREGFGIDGGVLEPVEPVEIFHQFPFFAF